MSTLSVTLNGREYRVACDDGQEMHLRRCAADLDQRIRDLALAMGPTTPDSVLLVMASIMLTDELSDATRELERGHHEEERFNRAQFEEKHAEFDATLTDTINEIAERIERLAGQLG